jgi:hypothetical protein
VNGYGVIYTPSHRKLAVGERVPGYSGCMSGLSGHWGPETPDSENFTDREQLPGDSGYMSGYSGRLCPDIPGLARDFTRRLFIVVGLILMVFVGSFEHNYHVNTCRSKSLLIVRHSYTQFQNKI